MNMKRSSLFVRKIQTDLRKLSKFLSICLLLIALFAPTAQAETVFVNPGTVGDTAQDFTFGAGSNISVDIVWTDNKTLEYTSGTHLFFLYGPPCATYTGVLLDAAGSAIPDSGLAGKSICATGSDLSGGVIELPDVTLFSGIRLVSSGFVGGSAWQWTWEENGKPVVGQTETSSNQPPIADAGAPVTGAVGTAVTFDGSASVDPDSDSIVSYDWDFGDGNYGTGVNPSHSYTGSDTYNVTLTVTDSDSLADSDSTTATIGAASTPPVADAGGPYSGTVGVNLPVSGEESTDADGNIVLYSWDFGDGNMDQSPRPQAGNIYAESGTNTITLTVMDNDGETDSDTADVSIGKGNQSPVADAGPPAEGVVGSAVSFDASGSSDPEDSVLQYEWDFGDGNNGTGVNPSHTYSEPGDYTVYVIVTDEGSEDDGDITSAAIGESNLPPRADAGPPVEGTAGVAVSFDASGSDDPDGGSIVTYAWDFGDSSPIDTVSGANPSHTYAVQDNYTVTLTVTDNDSLTDFDTTQAAIDQANSPPTSDAGSLYAGIVNQPVIFDGSAASDDDGDIIQYDWDFGDGTIGSGLYTTHTYTESGPFKVTLAVTDDSGDTDDSNAVVIVGDGAIQPPHVYTTGPYSGVVGVPMTVDGSNSSDPDGTINLYEWIFGDGNSSNGDVTSNNYKVGGLYRLILQVTDDEGFTASESTIARIGDLSVPPIAVANVNNEAYVGRVGVPVAINGSNSTDSDGNIVRYDWDFGDGNIDNDAGPTPSNTYAASGKYFTSLKVTDDSGETDTTVTAVTVGIGNLPPVAITGESITTVAGVAITFDGFASNDPDGSIESYTWNFGDGTTDNGEIVTHTYSDPGTYIATLSVTDNDGASSSGAVVVNVLDPAGVHPPTKPILRTPENGSVVDLGPNGSITLAWRPSNDPDGGDVNYEVYLCTDENPLTRCSGTEVATYPPSGSETTLYASIVPVANSENSHLKTIALLSALICIGLLGFSWSTRRRTLLYIMLAFSLSAFIGCSDSSSKNYSAPDVTYQAEGLSPNTTYYWAVVAEDDQGEESTSDVWSFTTR
jgi:PKD repeat protein